MALVRQYVPHILIGLVIGTIIAASYGTVAYGPSGSNATKIIWSPTSVTITFSASSGSSHRVGPVSFYCSRDLSTGLVVDAKTSNPSKVKLTAIPNQFSGCSSNDDETNDLRLIASCLVPASQCKGSYTGSLTVRAPTIYQTLAAKKNLKITIVVNGDPPHHRGSYSD